MNDAAPAGRDSQYVTMEVDGEVFAVAVDQVREILDMRRPTRVPNAPPFMAGMIDLRGQGVPVVDLRTKLGLGPAEATEHTRIVVIETRLEDRPFVLGMIADRVIEVTALAETTLEQPPEIGVRWRSDYIRAIGRARGSFVIILDLARLFASEEAALADAG